MANAAHIKNVPGRKTDVNDATWIADLVACGLIRASFVPDEAIQQLRSLLRARKQLSREQTSHIQRIQKTLEEANIKLDAVISDVLGVSGRRMIEAMIAGVRNPHKLAALADRRIKASPKVLYDALHGRLTEHHRFMLELYRGQHDALSKAIAKIDDAVDAAIARMDEEVPPGQATFRSLILLPCSVPGINVLGATIVLAEIGREMSRFPTAGHLLAWAGMCPGQNESAGKRKSSRLRKGAPWLKTILVQCAWAATRKKDSYYGAQFKRLRAKRGPKKAICAVAASMLTAIYHILKDGTTIRISAPIISTDVRTRPEPGITSLNSPGLASASNYNPLLRWPERPLRGSVGKPVQSVSFEFLRRSPARFSSSRGSSRLRLQTPLAPSLASAGGGGRERLPWPCSRISFDQHIEQRLRHHDLAGRQLLQCPDAVHLRDDDPAAFLSPSRSSWSHASWRCRRFPP